MLLLGISLGFCFCPAGIVEVPKLPCLHVVSCGEEGPSEGGLTHASHYLFWRDDIVSGMCCLRPEEQTQEEEESVYTLHSSISSLILGMPESSKR